MNARRRGKSLIEMLVVMAVLSVVLTITGHLLAAMMRADNRSRDAVADRAMRQRFVQQFRADAHAARSARLLDDRPGEPGIVLLIADAKPVEYRATYDRVARIVGEGDVAHAADRLQLSSATAEFALDAEQNWAELTLIPIVDESVPPRRETRLDGPTKIRAVLGRDARFLPADQETE